MEPLDTDLDYAEREPRPAQPGSRFSVMFILPILGVLLVLTFIGAAIFQWNLSDLIDSLVGVLLLLFVIAVALMFWAGALQGLPPLSGEWGVPTSSLKAGIQGAAASWRGVGCPHKIPFFQGWGGEEENSRIVLVRTSLDPHL